MSKLTIYKASAGSGKTYRLVLEYLKLLVQNPQNYRHTLAVTFTNKATAEMKERIMRDLFAVVNGKNQNLLNDIKRETGISEQVITRNAGLSLSLLLHDYDRFSVNTIDSFFQGVLRSFARELGLYGGYEVDLDSEAILSEACDRLIMGVEADKDLRNWLLSMVEEKLVSGKNWQVRDEIIKLGKEFLKEASLPFQLNMPSREQERENIKELKKRLIPKMKGFESKCRKLGERGLKLMDEYGLQLDDFSYKKSSFAGKFEKLANFPVDDFDLGTRFLGAFDNIEKWATAKKRDERMEKCYSGGMNELVGEIIGFFDENEKEYLTAVEIYKNIYTLGVLSVLLSNIREIGQENNSLMLNEGNMLLRGIIGQNDAPFVYEKTGNWYHHFLFDEFQDTSVVQWENFRPLVINSLSENHSNLVVGDVKQSIYRWRNSDWTLLGMRLPGEVSRFGVYETSLDSNWRSAETIVNFNNNLFSRAPSLLQAEFDHDLENNGGGTVLFDEYNNAIENAFSDVVQKTKAARENGLVSLSFIPDDDESNYEGETYKQLINAVKTVQDKGYLASDIAILVTKNKTGSKIANVLMNYGKKAEAKGYNFNVMSNDSLLLGSSPVVQFLVLIMAQLIKPWDRVIQATLTYHFQTYVFPVLQNHNVAVPKITMDEQQQINFDEEDENPAGFFSRDHIRDYFPFFDKEQGRLFRQKWVAMPLIDFVEELITLYRLSDLPGEQASIEAFKDTVIDFTWREGSNIQRFVDWWEENSGKQKLQTTDQRDAIRIMTVHKAKGLEFPVVMVPFCDWGFGKSGNSTSFTWCETGKEYSDLFPVVPVVYSKRLQKTGFSSYYYTETLLTVIDNLNVLYVALTRAVEALYVFTKAEKEKTKSGNKKKDEINTVAKLLGKTTRGDGAVLPQSGENIFLDGKLATKRQSKKESSEFNLSETVAVKKDISKILLFHKNFENFLEKQGSERQMKINRGKLVHEVLSSVITTDDIVPVLEKMTMSGKMGRTDAAELEKELAELLNQPSVCKWFDGTYRVLNETTIVLPGFDLYRPDRIMVRDNEAVIVDYKTGDVVSNAHRNQVKRYAGLLNKMGYEKVTGFVWYLKTGKLLNVDEVFNI
ncbi:MAG: UvrD-helicase domain-containing protein [Prolixibacteraceae bacterium]|nr:UvrD-helicase domain-containing protein [Prolixibacteraceae bacterium]